MPLSEKPYLSKVVYSGPPHDSNEASNFPFNIPFLNHLTELEFHADITFIIGENGTGKSTFMEAIASNLGFNAEGGTKSVNFETKSEDHKLSNFIKCIKGYKKPADSYFLRAESFYNVATYMDSLKDSKYLRAYGGKSLHEQSHGESFLSLISNKFRGNGLYLLDEPEAALSPQRQLAAIAIIDQLVNNKSQFIIATHSPIFMAYPKAKILQIDENGICETELEQTEHFIINKMFFQDPEGMMKRIIEE